VLELVFVIVSICHDRVAEISGVFVAALLSDATILAELFTLVSIKSVQVYHTEDGESDLTERRITLQYVGIV
jgi:hypothetical protein